MDVGLSELLVFTLLPVAVSVFALYWIIRLGVKHGIEDAEKYGRVSLQRSQAQDPPTGPGSP